MAEALNLLNCGDIGSEYEFDSEYEKQRTRRQDLAIKEKAKKVKLAAKSELSDEHSKEEGRKQRYQILSFDAYDRHRKFINDYLLYYGGSSFDFKRDASRDKTDYDVLREHHKFLWDEDDDEISEDENTVWEKRLAKKYYDKLFKEYCIADLSRYKENKIALRWRIEKEVVDGKGQFSCGEKRCMMADELRSWEVNFAYVEHGVKRNALVKVRLCPECSYKLNYRHRKRDVTKQKRSHDDAVDDAESSVKRHKSSGDTNDKSGKINRLTDGGDEGAGTKDGSHLQANAGKTSSSGDDSDANVWSKPVVIAEEKSREDEFDEYFEDLFL